MLPSQDISLKTIDSLYETVQKNVDHFQNTLQRELHELENNHNLTPEERNEKEDLIKEMNFANKQTATILKKISHAREEYINTDGNIRQEYISLFEQFGLIKTSESKQATNDEMIGSPYERRIEWLEDSAPESLTRSSPSNTQPHSTKYSPISDRSRSPMSSHISEGDDSIHGESYDADRVSHVMENERSLKSGIFASSPGSISRDEEELSLKTRSASGEEAPEKDQDDEEFALTQQLKAQQQEQQRRENRTVFDELEDILERESSKSSQERESISLTNEEASSLQVSSPIDFEVTRKKLRELEEVKEERNKIRRIAESLAVHVENLQRTNQNLKMSQANSFEEQLERSQTYMDLIETMVGKENALLKSHIEQLKREMQMRKTVFNEEMLRLKKLVVETLERDGDENFIFGLSDPEVRSMKESMSVLHSLGEFSKSSVPVFIQDSWYQPIDPSDDLDCAVNEVLRELECPVRIEIERVRPGEYFVDKLIQLRFINGQVVVRNNTSYEQLADYLRRLYSPFFQVQQFFETGAEDTLVNDDYRSQEQVMDYESSYSNRSELPPAHRIASDTERREPRNTRTNSSTPSRSRSTSPSVRVNSPGKRSSTPQSRSSSPRAIDSQMRYASILKSAMEKKKLVPANAPEPKKPPVNSSANDRRLSPRRVSSVREEPQRTRSPLREQYEQRQRVKQQVVQQQVQESEYREFDNIRKGKPNRPSSTASSTSSGSMLEGIDLNDRAKLRQLHKMALKKQIAQMSRK